MLAVPRAVTHRVHKRLSLVGPDGLVVELPRVPHYFVHELRETDGVAGWTRARGLEGSRGGIGDVGFVVGGVDVFAVPAAAVR